ncbi:MAG: DUF4838 domain-containing protein [Lentisphaerae bacterium]|nr:DUF4838 domain-containing protein [Lentisphaerota bacterium]
MSKVFSVVCFLLCLGMFASPVLLSSGDTRPLVIPKLATPQEHLAASELSSYLRKMGLGEYEVVTENTDAVAPAIYIGWCQQSSKLLGREANSYSPGEFSMLLTPAGELVLTGHPQHGPLYAVYQFLEQYCGVRFWGANDETIPALQQLELVPFAVTKAPAFVERSVTSASHYGNLTNYFNSKKLTNSGIMKPEEGGTFYTSTLAAVSHTAERFVPDEAFFKSHRDFYGENEVFPGSKPEYFALRDGRRLGASEGQPCQTNPEVALAAAENIAKLLRRRGKKYSCVNLTQNDNTNYCQCSNCQAEESRLGNQADLNIAFVNKVAELLQEEFPGMILETFAYQYTLPPPKTVRPSKYIRVRVCLIEANAAQALDHPSNATFLEWLKGWCEVSENVGVWHYTPNFTNCGLAHPSLTAIPRNMQIFKQLGVKYNFVQDYSNAGDFGWFAVYRDNLSCKTLFNPEIDETAYRRQFFKEYYGLAAKPMFELSRLYDQLGQSSPLPITCYQFDTSHWLPAKQLLQGEALIAEAEAAVEPETPEARRVAMMRLVMDWTRLWRHENTVLAKLTGSPPVASPEWIAATHAGIEARLAATPRTPGWKGFYTSLGKTYQKHLETLAGYLAPEPKHIKLPVELEGIPFEHLVIIPQARYAVVSGQTAVADYKLPEGTAVRLALKNYIWAMRIDLPTLLNAGEWEILFEARFPDAVTAPEGKVAIGGVYAYGTNFAIKTEIPIMAEALSNQRYTLISLGTTDFSRDGQIYLAATNNVSAQEILAGRFFLRKRCN